MREKDIVNYLATNWDKYFNGEDTRFNGYPLEHHKTEYSVMSTWRCDMLNYITIPHAKDASVPYKAPIYTEVKYDHNGRDLVYELQKGLDFIKRSSFDDYPRYTCVIADNTLDATTLKFIKDNNILYYQYSFDGFNLETMTIRKMNEDL